MTSTTPTSPLGTHRFDNRSTPVNGYSKFEKGVRVFHTFLFIKQRERSADCLVEWSIIKNMHGSLKRPITFHISKRNVTSSHFRLEIMS